MSDVKLLKEKYLLPMRKPEGYVPISDMNSVVSYEAKGQPRPYRLRLIADQFRRLSNVGGNGVDFETSIVPCVDSVEEPICNTTACHGGWSVLALNNLGYLPIQSMCNRSKLRSRYICKNTNNQMIHINPSYYGDFDFHAGVEWLSYYLFDDETLEGGKLWYWAALNPDLWGGRDGGHMFDANGHIAFINTEIIENFKDENYASIVNLNDIADRYDDCSYMIEQKYYK